MNAPEPVNEDDFKDKPEIRGGNRPADYQPVAVQGDSEPEVYEGPASKKAHRDDEPDGQGEFD